MTPPIDSHARLEEVANEMLRQAIFKGADLALAARLLEQHPDVARFDIFTAVAAGDFEEVERRLAVDPAAAARAGGPFDWPPLLYLAYLRWPDSAAQSVAIARALLDRGADPNAGWRDDWENPFRVLTGVIGLGEGVQPPHERADELVELLLERGAEPFDTQTLYNTSVVRDDTHWLEVLWAESERRGGTDLWRNASVGEPLRGNWLDLILSIAVSYDHLRRAQWALTHGAVADGSNAYSKRLQREEALVRGNDAMVDLLTRFGAPAAPVEGKVAFLLACRARDFAEVRKWAALRPDCLQDPEPLSVAARHGQTDLIELLLDLGIDVDIADQGGVRALHHAAGAGAVAVVKLLIARGADVDRPTQHYGGPLGFAAHFGQRETAAVLAPLSRDVHDLVFLGMKDRLRELFAAEPALANLLHDRSRVTPLFTLPSDEAAALDMAGFLLANGADRSVRSIDGDTPADAARKRGFAALAELLAAPRR